MADELINLTDHVDDEHLIVFRDGQLFFYLPSSCPIEILLCVMEDLVEEFTEEIQRRAKDTPR